MNGHDSTCTIGAVRASCSVPVELTEVDPFETVATLVRKLLAMPQDAQVYVREYDDGFGFDREADPEMIDGKVRL